MTVLVVSEMSHFRHYHSIRDRLLSRLPQPANLAGYREEVAATLEKNSKNLRSQKRVSVELLVFAVALSVAFLALFIWQIDTTMGLHFEILACYAIIWPFALMGIYWINHCRVELLKEVKQVQLQVLELQAPLRKGGDQ
jgi:hypothetical protein